MPRSGALTTVDDSSVDRGVGPDRAFEEVLAALRDGEPWAWRTVYDELSPAVLGYLRMQRAPNPEDILSEVFLQVVRDLGSFSGDRSNFRSWVFTIAHHRIIDARRHRQRRPAFPTEDEVIDRRLDPVEIESDIIEQLTTEELGDLLEVLTPDQRAVILLRVVGELTMHETADVLGKGYEACRALQRRGLASLREELAADPYPFKGGVALTRANP